MKNQMLIGGLVLFIFGIFLWFFIGPTITTSGIFGFNPITISLGIILMWLGVIFTPIGAILAIVGAIISPKEIYLHNYQFQNQRSQSIQQKPIPPKEIYCPNCDVKTDESKKFCYKCGVKLK